MIIDSHVHIGNIMNFNMPEEMVLKSMEKYKIHYSLVSNIEASEVDGNRERILIEFHVLSPYSELFPHNDDHSKECG